jgi:hypothetical protein
MWHDITRSATPAPTEVTVQGAPVIRSEDVMSMAMDRNAFIFKDSKVWGMLREFRWWNMLENLYLKDRQEMVE